MSQSPYGPQSWKYLLSGPYRNILPSPALKPSSFPFGREHVNLVVSPIPFLSSQTHGTTKSRDWFLTSISEFSYLFNDISTFTFIKCVALPRSSLGTLHTYSDAAASVLDILGAALQSQVIWHLRKFPSPSFWNQSSAALSEHVPTGHAQMLANLKFFQSTTQAIPRNWLQVLKIVP